MLPMILGKASKVQLIRAFGNLSMKQIVEESFPSVAALSREHGQETIEKAMSIVLLDLSESFDGELSKDAAEEICAEINSSMLRNLSLEDIYLVCRDIKLNTTYKLTVNRVLKQMSKHFEERCEAAARHNDNKHMSTKFIDRDRKGDIQQARELMREARVMHMSGKLDPTPSSESNNTKAKK